MPDVRAWLETLSSIEILGYSLAGALVLVILLRLLLALASRTKTEVDQKIVQALRWPLFLSLAFLGVYFAIKRLEEPPTPGALETTGRVLMTIAALLWTRAAMRISDEVLDALARRADDYRWIEPRSLPMYDILAKLLVVGGGIWAIIETWGINPTPWLASAGIVGIAVGFAAKDTLANLFAGIFILADAPYKLGDFIVFESGERGRVTDIGIRSTRILTRDDIEITIPNAVIANSKIVNETGGHHMKERIRVTVGIAYGTDVDKVRAALMDVARNCDMIAQDQEPRVRFREFGDSALIFQLMCWIDEPVLRGRVIDRLNTDVYKRFAADGIEIPFPQRVVHMQK